MDQIVKRAGVPRVKVYYDDVTIPGRSEDWRKCWTETCAVLRALTKAGLMINLRKCKFLSTSVVVLGYQLFEGGYTLARKFLNKWTTLAVPKTTRELQKLLGKLLWCSPFVPGYKELIRPIEALLSPKNEGNWT